MPLYGWKNSTILICDILQQIWWNHIFCTHIFYLFLHLIKLFFHYFNFSNLKIFLFSVFSHQLQLVIVWIIFHLLSLSWQLFTNLLLSSYVLLVWHFFVWMNGCYAWIIVILRQCSDKTQAPVVHWISISSPSVRLRWISLALHLLWSSRSLSLL